MTTNKNGFATSRGERWAYWIFFLGQNIMWGWVKYASTFLTDIGIAAATASLVLLFPKVWDAINDTIFGYLVDRFRFKNGQKFLPWVRLGVVIVGVTVIALFAIPATIGSQAVKIVWFLIAYILFDAAYTMLDAPMFALTTVMTNNIQERTSIIAGAKLWSMVGAMLVVVLVSPLRAALGGWGLATAVIVAVAVAFMLPILFKGKERHREEPSQKKESITLKQMFNYVGKNKYLLFVLIAMLVIGVTNVENVMSIYLARHCFGNESYNTIISVCVALPVILMSLVIPKMAKKWDKFVVLIGGLIFSVITGIVAYFVGYSNLILAIIFIALKCIGMAFYTVICYMLIADSVEYGNYKSGTRATGITFSLQTFVAKVNGAVVSSVALAILALTGFVEGEGAVQPETVGPGIWAEFTLIPAAGYLVAILFLIFVYKLRDKDVQVMAAYNNGEISRADAESLLADRFGPAADIVAPVEVATEQPQESPEE